MRIHQNPLNDRKPTKLIFPSGRSVERAKADAKALAKSKTIPLHEAQDQIAMANGLSMSWREAINYLNTSGAQSGNTSPVDEILKKLIKGLDSNFEARPGAGRIFHDTAVAFVICTVPALVDLVRGTNEAVDLNMLLKYADYRQYCLLLDSPSISAESRQSIMGYITTRAGYQEHISLASQTEDIRRQFEFVEWELASAVLNSQGRLAKKPYSPYLAETLRQGMAI